MAQSSKPFKYYNDRFKGSDGLIPKLYKFYPISVNTKSDRELNGFLLDTIRQNYLWHADPDTLNDPFDCYKALVDYRDPSIETIRWLAEHRGYNSLDELQDEIYRLWNNKAEVIASYKATTPIWYICSFTTNLVSNTMWSHYAGCHTGLCLTFDSKKLLVDQIMAYNVTYEEDFKAIDFFEQPEEAILNMVLTKSIEWKYEDEYRSFEPIGGKHFFDKSCLTGITFGCKTTLTDMKTIRSMVDGAGYNNICWSQAIMRADSFDLAIQPLI
jgi:hypothetical protein